MFVYEYYYMIAHDRHMYVIAVSGNRKNFRNLNLLLLSGPKQHL